MQAENVVGTWEPSDKIGSSDLFYMRIHNSEKLNASVDSLMLNESDDRDLIMAAQLQWPLCRHAVDHVR